MATYSYIFARGGSKGIPGKNLKLINNKPLLAHSINMALNIKEITRCFVSTDSDEISSTAIKYGAEVIKRPGYLSEDNSSEWLAWKHAVNWTNKKYGHFDKFISIPTTAPLRIKSDVENCLKTLDSDTDIVITITNSHRNPFFNMVKSKNGYLRKVIDNDQNFVRRQDAPQIYDMTTIAFVTRPEFIINNESLWDGRIKGVKIPKERSIDIDDNYDLDMARYLYSKYRQNYDY